MSLAAGARVPPGRGLQSAYLSAPTGRTKSALIVTQDFSPGRPRSGATRSGGSSGRGVAYYAEKDTSKADILFQRSAAIPTCAPPSASGPRCARPPLRSPLVFLLTIAHKKRTSIFLRMSFKDRRRPTLPLLRSTIGAAGLNFSVRNGKRWDPCAVTT